MDVELTPGADFKAVAARLRGAAPEIRRELNAAVRSATQPAQRELQQAIKGVQSKGQRGGGHNTRAALAFSRSKRGSAGTRASHGLRNVISKSIQTKITYTGYKTGVRIRVDSSKLPASQRSLPRLMNKGRWRHQVFGNGTYVGQTATPRGWFDNTMRRMGPQITKEIDAAARRAMEKLQ